MWTFAVLVEVCLQRSSETAASAGVVMMGRLMEAESEAWQSYQDRSWTLLGPCP